MLCYVMRFFFSLFVDGRDASVTVNYSGKNSSRLFFLFLSHSVSFVCGWVGGNLYILSGCWNNGYSITNNGTYHYQSE